MSYSRWGNSGWYIFGFDGIKEGQHQELLAVTGKFLHITDLIERKENEPRSNRKISRR